MQLLVSIVNELVAHVKTIGKLQYAIGGMTLISLDHKFPGTVMIVRNRFVSVIFINEYNSN
jgi:hypothetical protein